MSTRPPQLTDSERQELVDLGWDVDSPHQPVPIEHMPDVQGRNWVDGDRIAIKLSDNRKEEGWISLEASKRILDVPR